MKTTDPDLEAFIEALMLMGHVSNCDGDPTATTHRLLAAEALRYKSQPHESRTPSACPPEQVSLEAATVPTPKPKRRRR